MPELEQRLQSQDVSCANDQVVTSESPNCRPGGCWAFFTNNSQIYVLPIILFFFFLTGEQCAHFLFPRLCKQASVAGPGVKAFLEDSCCVILENSG